MHDPNTPPAAQKRPVIAFFDYPDVFEDFYPQLGVSQQEFATQWAASGNHAFVTLLQREIGDVIWYAFSLAPELREAVHDSTGCRVRFLRSGALHRVLWKTFWLSGAAWRWKRLYPAFAATASYLALVSLPFLRTLWRDRPDFLFVQDYATGRFDMLLLLARALGIPLVAYHAGSRPEHYLGRIVKRWSIPRAARILVSGAQESTMLRTRFGVAPDRLALILTPIDTRLFRPVDRTAACCSAGLNPARRYLLFVGRLDDRVKRVSAFLRSFAALAQEHPDADVVIVGDGPDGASLRALAGELAPSRVRFTGWVEAPEALANLYNAAECLVLPSWREGFPSVVGEAMACGTPVVASRVGGIPEMVEDGCTGWTIPAGDDAALTAALSHVLRCPQVMTAMRAAARAKAERMVAPAAVAARLRTVFTPGPGEGGGDRG